MVPRCDLIVDVRTRREPCDSSSEVGGVMIFACGEDEDAADDTVLPEATLAIDGVGDELRARRDVGELGIAGKGSSRPEKRKSMLSSGDPK